MKARVDAVAVMLRGGVDVDDVCGLEVGYAPPFASAMDVMNNAGNSLDNILAGTNRPIDAVDFLQEYKAGHRRVLDIRGERDAAPFVEKYGPRWFNIPQGELRTRYSELSADEPLFIICDTGARSYESQVLLGSRGITDTLQVQGGYAMIKMLDPEF